MQLCLYITIDFGMKLTGKLSTFKTDVGINVPVVFYFKFFYFMFK